MNFRITLLLALVLAAFGCSSGDIPIPYMVDQVFELQEGCISDFSAEEGRCISIVDGLPLPYCFDEEEGCVEHFYIQYKRDRPHFTHINAKYPCYPDWMYQRYSDSDSQWFQHDYYRVVSMELASDIVKDTVHLIEILTHSTLQQHQYCYYRVEGAIEDLSKGEYELMLWNPDREIILSTDLNGSPNESDTRTDEICPDSSEIDFECLRGEGSD